MIIRLFLIIGIAGMMPLGATNAASHDALGYNQVYAEKLKTKRDKLKKPKSFRHKHPTLKLSPKAQAKGAGAYSHRHGKFGYHTHRTNDLFDISPQATTWPEPGKTIILREHPRVPQEHGELDLKHEIELALVVVEETNGVNIIRNVRTQTSQTKEVRSKATIGSSTVPKPLGFISDDALDFCKRRLKSVNSVGTISFGNLSYCQ